MGFEVAQAALDAGAGVTLIAGLINLNAPMGERVIEISTSLEVRDAVENAINVASAFDWSRSHRRLSSRTRQP